ncbi:flagellar basal body-associated protein FliL [Herbaspirillum autotrophicum]|uniref:flagellar basal body-associated protein FliL n=1 Tax=Herbaspirillum autotrophicum TaxID=180195 RepID=UPI00067C9D3F|nr:flagellar basal body-associated protein FliL [Herbaspirillum autotrophicum]
MATKAPAKAAPAAEAPAAKSSKKMLFIIIGLVLVLVIGGGAAAFMLMGKSKKASDDHVEEKAVSKVPVFVVIEPFVVNLMSETSGDQFLQIAMTLQVPNQETSDAIKLFMPQVRSRLLMVLSSKKASELLSNDGKKALTEEIIDQLGEPFASGKGPNITDVFYTSFVIQQQ